MFSGNHLTELFKTPEENREIGSRKYTAIRFWNQTTYSEISKPRI